jgi:hypothetical protein
VLCQMTVSTQSFLPLDVVHIPCILAHEVNTATANSISIDFCIYKIANDTINTELAVDRRRSESSNSSYIVFMPRSINMSMPQGLIWDSYLTSLTASRRLLCPISILIWDSFLSSLQLSSAVIHDDSKQRQFSKATNS